MKRYCTVIRESMRRDCIIISSKKDKSRIKPWVYTNKNSIMYWNLFVENLWKKFIVYKPSVKKDNALTNYSIRLLTSVWNYFRCFKNYCAHSRKKIVVYVIKYDINTKHGKLINFCNFLAYSSHPPHRLTYFTIASHENLRICYVCQF